MVPPRYATPRDPSRRTMGGAVARVSAALGQPLMPWQRYVADVTGEVDDNGKYVHRLAIVSIQRQSGKTTLDLATSIHRALQGPNRKVWHTAQTGLDARKKWVECVERIMESPLREAVAGRPRRTNGAESLTFVNGSNFRPHPPTRDALHGEQSDCNNIDEAWVFDELQGADLFQAIIPTQLTRPGAQTFIWSTRGDASSTWFHGLIDRAKEPGSGIALFDWGIPDGADPMDLDVVCEYHPAYGYTVDRDALAAAQTALRDKPGEFARAYGNRATGSGERVIPAEAWAAAATTADLPAGVPAYGVAVSGDGTMGALLAAVVDADGVPWVEEIEHRPGRSWLVERVQALRDAGQGVAGIRRGPAGPVLDALELAGVEVHDPGADYSTACQDFHDRLTDPAGPRIRIRRSEALDAAADVAGRRIVSDGAWVWSRTRSTGEISTVEAATLASWLVARAPVPIGTPTVHFR